MLDTPYALFAPDHSYIPALIQAGHGAVIRYASPNTQSFPDKHPSPQEIQALASNNILTMLVFEKTSDLETLRGDAGTQHVNYALSLHRHLIPDFSALYRNSNLPEPNTVASDFRPAMGFAIDNDADQAQLDDIVLPYFAQIHPIASANGYLITAYGSKFVTSALKSAGLCHYEWVAGSYGWQGSRHAVASQSYDILQIPSDNANPTTLPLGPDDSPGDPPVFIDLNVHALSPSQLGFWRI